MTEEFRRLVNQEIDRVKKVIDPLERYLNALVVICGTPDSLEEDASKLAGYQPKPVTAIHGLTEGKVPSDGQPNTLKMAHTVLLNLNGEERKPDEIRAQIGRASCRER